MRKSIIVHLDSLEVLSELTNEQAGILFKAIKSYANGIEPELDFSMKLAFLPFKNQFIRDSEKYEKTCEVRRLAGSIGGKQKVANASKSKQKVANLADSDNKSKNDSKKDSDNKKDNYGVNENIILSITDYEKLKVEFGEHKTNQAIDYLSNWGLEKPSKFKEYKNHNLALRRWVFDAIDKKYPESKTETSNHLKVNDYPEGHVRKTYMQSYDESLEKAILVKLEQPKTDEYEF